MAGSGEPQRTPTFRERHHRLIWALIWPVRLWFVHSPLNRGKGLLLRAVILPALPPQPADFEYAFGNGLSIRLAYRESLGTKMLLERQYEEIEIARMCEYVVPGTAVLDVGANIGLCSMSFARATGPAGRVISFEPHPITAARLASNLARNGIANVTIEQAAVADQPGSVTFHESENSMLNSAVVIPPGYKGSFDVPVVTVDAVWNREGRPAVSLFKIDVEGGELAVLQGASELIASEAPAIMFEAWGDEQLGPIVSHLTGLGYHRVATPDFDPRNHLFAKAG